MKDFMQNFIPYRVFWKREFKYYKVFCFTIAKIQR